MQVAESEPLHRLVEEHNLAFIVNFESPLAPEAPVTLGVMPLDEKVTAATILAILKRLVAIIGQGQDGLLWLPSAPWHLCLDVARTAHVYVERRPGLFDEFRRFAYMRAADSEFWVDRLHVFLRKYRPGMADLSSPTLCHHLGLMVGCIRELEEMLAAGRERILAQPSLRHSVERLLELLAGYAVAIIGHRTGLRESVCYESFGDAAAAGWLDQQLAEDLGALCAVRSMLLHECPETQTEVLYEVATESLPLWKLYVATIRATRPAPSPQPPPPSRL